MFISWGSRGKLAEGGSTGQRTCNFCGQDSNFTRMVEYVSRHVYWIFRWTTDRTSYQICGNCGGAHHDDVDLRAPEVVKTIPAWDRLGWLISLGGVAVLVASASIAAAADHANDKVYAHAPQVGDVYEADVARLMTHPQADRMYAAMRVTKVGADGIEVETAMRFYNEWRGVDRDLDDGAASAPGYYGPDRQTLAPGAVEKMYQEGILHDVRR